MGLRNGEKGCISEMRTSDGEVAGSGVVGDATKGIKEKKRESVGIPGYTQAGIVRKRRIFLGRNPTALELKGRW